jgi:hypothetical protein
MIYYLNNDADEQSKLRNNSNTVILLHGFKGVKNKKANSFGDGFFISIS